MAALADAHRLIKRPKAKTERIEAAPHDLPWIFMWCDHSTAPICSGFTISHIGGIISACLRPGRAQFRKEIYAETLDIKG